MCCCPRELAVRQLTPTGLCADIWKVQNIAMACMHFKPSGRLLPVCSSAGSSPAQVMHAGRTKAPEAQAPAAAALLERWRRSRTFYASPFGSNDDWCAGACRAGLS